LPPSDNSIAVSNTTTNNNNNNNTTTGITGNADQTDFTFHHCYHPSEADKQPQLLTFPVQGIPVSSWRRTQALVRRL